MCTLTAFCAFTLSSFLWGYTDSVVWALGFAASAVALLGAGKYPEPTKRQRN